MARKRNRTGLLNVRRFDFFGGQAASRWDITITVADRVSAKRTGIVPIPPG